jgi:tryptophanyl-tRNA synthetase
MAQGLKRKVEAVEEHEQDITRGTAEKASMEVAVVVVRIRMNHPNKVWAVKVIKTRIVDGNHMETREEKGNPRGCVVIAIIKVVIIQVSRLTHQEVAVVR